MAAATLMMVIALYVVLVLARGEAGVHGYSPERSCLEDGD